MTPSRLAWIGASVRLPLTVVRVLVIAPGRLLWLAMVPAAFRRRRLASLETECKNHVGPGVRAWWLSADQGRRAGASGPVVGVLMKDVR